MKKLFSLLKLKIIIILVPILVISNSCRDNSPVEPDIESRGYVISASSIGTYSTAFLQVFINSLAGSLQSNANLRYDIEVYKVVYKTNDPKGNLVTASGALFVPKGKDNLSLLSLQHGTQTRRSNVASVNPLNAPDGLIAASLGYFALVPDYLGLGESNILHPYHHQKSSAESVIDFIRAGRSFARTKNIKLNGQVFLAGYSEGGYVTLAAHKEIEQNYQGEIAVVASAPMAGAFDLILTARTIIQKQTYNQPSFLAFFFVAYNNIYGWNNLDQIFNSPYAARIPLLFDGTKSTTEISAQLTPTLNQLFKQSFINGFLNGTESVVISAFESNSLLNWAPKAPIRFYHGDADEYVPYENSVTAKNFFRSLGANVELITIDGGTHASSVLPSIMGAVEWFESIRINKFSYPLAHIK
ncbi:MAG: lipase family protein [Melioribacteraceae bacterium]|nr:lipase family protein [Melioribacteraceae bacterium]